MTGEKHMKYITGIHALNLNCELETTGDWHMSALQWDNPQFMHSYDSVFGEYGIERNKSIPGKLGRYNVANHIRACLDLLAIGNFPVAQGINKDFICNEKYDDEIFNMVLKLRNLPHYDDIDKFMGKEYAMKWVRFKKSKEVN
jgi:hypothetical protein